MNDLSSTASETREDLGLTEEQTFAIAAGVAVVGVAAALTYLVARSRARANRPLLDEPLRRLLGAATVLGGGESAPPQRQTVPPAVKSMLFTGLTALAKYGIQRWLDSSGRRGHSARTPEAHRSA